MKKLILVLVIALIATQAFGLTVTLSKRSGQNIVDINYADACSTNLPRAFALDVNIGGAKPVFSAIGDYYIGESNSMSQNNRRYGIYPAQITFYDANDEKADPCHKEGDVNSWGSPLAAQGDIGAIGVTDQVMPSKHVILEFASLYKNPTVGGPNSPTTSGRLCSLTVDCNGGSNSSIAAKEEDTYRGGIVLEDGTAIDLSITPLPWTGCLQPPGKAHGADPCNAATGVALTKDLSWIAGDGATSHDVYWGTTYPPTSRGNQPGTTYDTGTMAVNTKYYWRIDEKNDAGTTTGDLWVFDTNCLYLGKVFDKTLCTPNLSANIVVNSTMMTQWNSSYVGKAKCWCCNPQKCGNGIYTPSATLNKADGLDLAQVKKSYGKNYNVAGYVKCVDFNISGKVDGIDLAILKKHYGQTVGSTGCQ